MKPGRSKSVRDAEAIGGARAAETWQLDEVHSALTELNEGRNVPHGGCGEVAAVVGQEA
jgi:predicted transcriptional regulator